MDSSSATRLRLLRDLNTDDVVRAAGMETLVRRAPVLRRLFDLPASYFAKMLDAFDQAAARDATSEAARDLLGRLGMTVRVKGKSLSEGPRLFISNHPGLGDVLSILTVLASPQLRIVAGDRPFLRAFPNISQTLLTIPEGQTGRALTAMVGHLQSGGPLLTFPAGKIEPDPAWFDPSVTWDSWSKSTQLLARLVKGLKVQPILVSGVRIKGFVDPWLTRLRRKPADRDWTAAILQLGWQLWRAPPRTITVHFGPVLEGTNWSLPEALRQMTMEL